MMSYEIKKLINIHFIAYNDLLLTKLSTLVSDQTMTEIKIDIEELFRLNLKKNQMINPSFEIYGAPTGFQTYGVLGAEIKRKMISLWRLIFCDQASNDLFNVYEIDTPIVGPEQMYIASGHDIQFTDPIVEDASGRIERVDHYLKDRIKKVAETDHINKNMYDDLLNNLANYNTDKLQELMEQYGEQSRNFGKIRNVILMMDTMTSISGSKSYLRPETAQGLFTEFKSIHRYNQESLPLGIAQIGKVYRKEIGPRPFIRLREFEQAEIELFYDPMMLSQQQLPMSILETEVNIYGRVEQESNLPASRIRLGTRIPSGESQGSINPYIVYFMYKIKLFCDAVGLDPNRLRFRQHLKNELAHYSADCWDLEYLVRDRSINLNVRSDDETNWIEIIGIADRGSYDLTQHSTHSHESMMVKRIHDPPIIETTYRIKFDMKEIAKKYAKKAQKIKQYISTLDKVEPKILDRLIENNNLNSNTMIDIDNDSIEITSGMCNVTKSDQEVRSEDFMPYVVEPSMGIDRMFYAILNNAFWIRSDDMDRTVLSLPDSLAPTTVAILPLFTKDVMMRWIEPIKQQIRIAKPLYNIKVDSTAASIGKRYSRLDEIGVPYAITIDYQTEEDQTVTVRARDSMTQIRVKIDRLFI
jgi:glycyl-tRNA synthetase